MIEIDDVMKSLATRPVRELMECKWYLSRLRGTPDIMLLEKMPAMLPQGEGIVVKYASKYSIIFCESARDRREVEEALSKPVSVKGRVVDLKAGIARPNTRPSVFPATRSTGVLTYEPPTQGWPYLVITMMPISIQGSTFGRDRYIWEAFETEKAMLRHLTELIAMYSVMPVTFRA